MGMNDLIEEYEDGIARFTLNRPESMNALTPPMLDRLAEALLEVSKDAKRHRVVVITGSGRGFCSGGDMKAANAAQSAPASQPKVTSGEPWRPLRSRMEAARLLHEMPQPTIASLPGAAAGAGLSLALACDFRIAVKGAKLVPAFAKVGLSGDFGGSYFLSQLIGQSRAREYYLLSKTLTAEEAFAMGAVNQIVEPGELEDVTRQWAKAIADGPGTALQLMKSNFNLAERGALADCLDQEARNHNYTSTTADHKEGARAFVERRAPEFNGE